LTTKKESRKTIKRNLHYNKDAHAYFYYKRVKHYLKDFDRESRLDLTCFTNAGYFGGIKFIAFDYNDYDTVILEEVE